MIDFTLWIFVGACWIWGFEYTFQEGEIFGKPGNWMRNNFPDWYNKPVFNCKYCMASFHGTIIFTLFMSDYVWYMWILYCFCLCGFTAILDKK